MYCLNGKFAKKKADVVSVGYISESKIQMKSFSLRIDTSDTEYIIFKLNYKIAFNKNDC